MSNINTKQSAYARKFTVIVQSMEFECLLYLTYNLHFGSLDKNLRDAKMLVVSLHSSFNRFLPVSFYEHAYLVLAHLSCCLIKIVVLVILYYVITLSVVTRLNGKTNSYYCTIYHATRHIPF